jgi:parvulin-like peptidyl-prolyl isomerase
MMRKEQMQSVLVFLALNAAALLLPCPYAMAIEDGIIAVVDSDVITAKDFQDYMRGLYSQLKIEGRNDKEISEILGKYESKGVEQLVEDRLIIAEANRQGMSIRPKAVDDRLEEIKGRYKNTGEFIAEINKEGVTISDIRKKIEDQLKARYIVTRDVRDKIYVNPQEVTDFYNAHRTEFQREARLYLQSIFVKSDGAFDEDAKKKIGLAWARISSGEDFKAVAAVYSELPDIGEISQNSLSPVFRSKTDTMSVGDNSGILTMPEGLYILKLTGRTAAVEPLLQDVKEEIYQKLFEIKFKDNFTAWIEKLRKKSYVEIRK